MLNLALILAIKVLLEWCYTNYVYPIYHNTADLYSLDFNITKWFVSYVLTVVVWLLFKLSLNKWNRVSGFILLVQFLIIVLPAYALFGLRNTPNWQIFLITLGFLGPIVVIWGMPSIKIRRPSLRTANAFVFIGLGLIAYVLFGLYYTGDIFHINFNFNDVYNIRDKYNETKIAGFGYVVPWVSYIINIAFLIYFFFKRKWLIVALLLFLQIIIFGATNFKSFLFAPIVAIGICYLVKYLKLERAIFLGVLFAFVVGLLVQIAGQPFGAGMLNRVFYMPTALHNQYFEYFSIHPFAMMSGTRFSILFDSSSSQTAIDLIAEHYWKGISSSPNVGWIGDAFAQFGYFGVLIYSVLLGVLLKIGDILSNKIRMNYFPVEGLLVGPALAFCSSAVPTVFLTHGFLILLVALWVLGAYQEKCKIPITRAS
ncbi:oligosaccharide repeat unit polymerase [Paralcaligenes ginsengisoli]